MANETTKFQAGRSYSCRSICASYEDRKAKREWGGRFPKVHVVFNRETFATVKAEHTLWDCHTYDRTTRDFDFYKTRDLAERDSQIRFVAHDIETQKARFAAWPGVTHKFDKATGWSAL